MDTISGQRELAFQLLLLHASNTSAAAKAMELTEPERRSLDARGFDLSSRQAAIPEEELSDQHESLGDSPKAQMLATAVEIYKQVSELSGAELVCAIDQRLSEIYGVEEATKPYNHPNTILYDMRYWAKIANYSAQEAALLCCGRDPSVELCEYLDALNPVEFTTSRFLADYVNRLNLLESAMNAGALSRESNAPQIVAWCRKLELPFPAELADLIHRYQGGSVSGETIFVEDVGRKERSSLLRLVAAMALEQYGYDPRKTRSSVLSGIVQDLDTTGLSMDRKTVSKWLREAVDLVPQDYWQGR